jgi:hypothetical protein
VLVNQKELRKTARAAGIRIVANRTGICIRPRLYSSSKSYWGLLLFMLAGLFFLSLPSWKPMDGTSVWIAYGFGALFTGGVLFAFLREMTDEVQVDSGEIRGRFNFRPFRISETEIVRFWSRSDTQQGRNSTFIVVTHYAEGAGRRVSLLVYSVDAAQQEEVRRLSTYINTLFQQALKS